MPICYQIDIDIIGKDEDGSEYPTRLPRVLPSPVPLTNDQIRDEVLKFWEEFAALLGDTAPDRGDRYRYGGTFQIRSIYNC